MFGEGNSYYFKYRLEDSRIGRFFSVDPLADKYPHYTPYSFSGNKLINCRELEGKEELPSFTISSIFLSETNSLVHNSTKTAVDVSKKVAKVVKENVGPIGTTFEVTGIILSAHPLTKPEGALLIEAGGYLSKLDLSISIIEKSAQGKYKSAVSELLIHNLGSRLDKQIEALNKIGKLDDASASILLLTNQGYGKIAEFALENYNSQNMQKVGNVKFDSNKVRKSKNGVLIAKDINTGKNYGVVRNKDGSYKFYNSSKKNK